MTMCRHRAQARAHARPAQRALDCGPRLRSVRHRDHGQVRQCCELQGVGKAGCGGLRQNCAQFGGAQRMPAQAVPVALSRLALSVVVAEAQLHGTDADRADDVRLGTVFGDPDSRLRLLPAEAVHQVDQGRLVGTRGGPDVDVPAGKARVLGGSRAYGLPVTQQGLCRIDECGARCGEHQAPADPVEERCADLTFEPSHGLRQRGTCAAECGSSLAHTAVLGHCEKVLCLAELHATPRSLLFPAPFSAEFVFGVQDRLC